MQLDAQPASGSSERLPALRLLRIDGPAAVSITGADGVLMGDVGIDAHDEPNLAD